MEEAENQEEYDQPRYPINIDLSITVRFPSALSPSPGCSLHISGTPVEIHDKLKDLLHRWCYDGVITCNCGHEVCDELITDVIIEFGFVRTTSQSMVMNWSGLRWAPGIHQLGRVEFETQLICKRHSD